MPSKEIDAALVRYGRLSARLADALNAGCGCRIELGAEPATAILESVNHLDTLLRSIQLKKAERHKPPPAPWNVAGLPIELFDFVPTVEWLESPHRDSSTAPIPGLSSLLSDANPDELKLQFDSQREGFAEWLKSFTQPSDRPNAERDLRALELHDSGKTWPEVAAELNVSVSQIKQACYRLRREKGLPKGKPGRPKKVT